MDAMVAKYDAHIKSNLIPITEHEGIVNQKDAEKPDIC